MPQLDPSSFASQLFWLIVIFGFLYLLVARRIIPDVGKVLRGRQDRIQKDIDQANNFKEEAKTIRAEYEATLQKTRNEAGELIAQAVGDGLVRAKSAHLELDAVLGKKLSEAEKKIEKARKEAVEKFTPLAADISKQVAAKLANIKVQDSAANEIVSKIMKG